MEYSPQVHGPVEEFILDTYNKVQGVFRNVTFRERWLSNCGDAQFVDELDGLGLRCADDTVEKPK